MEIPACCRAPKKKSAAFEIMITPRAVRIISSPSA
jgi:hypothetical protein